MISQNIYRADKKYRSLTQLSKPNRKRLSAQRLQLPAESPGFSFSQVQTNRDSCTEKAVGSRSARQKNTKTHRSPWEQRQQIRQEAPTSGSYSSVMQTQWARKAQIPKGRERDMADDSEQSHTQRKRKQEVREFKQRQAGHRTNLSIWLCLPATNLASRYWRLSYGITKG